MRIFTGPGLLVFCLTVFYTFADNAIAFTPKEVSSRGGNIYYLTSTDHLIQITHSGKDSSPILSPDQTTIAFIRIGDKAIPEGCGDFADTKTPFGNQLWTYNLITKKEQLLVGNNFECNKPEKEIVDPDNLYFSPDGKILYFISSAWVTSGALHAVNSDGTNLRYVIPANSFQVIPKGQYKGYLIVYQHRYYIGGGSYDWYWLFTPEGKAEGPLGDEITTIQREFLESD